MAKVIRHETNFNHDIYTIEVVGTKISITIKATAFVVKKWLSAKLYFCRHHVYLKQLVVGLGVQFTPGPSDFIPSPADTLQLCVKKRYLIFQLTRLRRFLSAPPPSGDGSTTAFPCSSGASSASSTAKYVGDEKEQQGNQREGLNQMDKTLVVEGARISYCIWEVQGDGKSEDQLPMACMDSVAILIMFDLTSRCTLNSVVGWYKEARKWNQTAIPVLIGTKFDDFIQLPIDLQWTIANEARKYAKALNATLFFSSATYNINVNKIFKFITAKLFDLPWTVERNLTVGEPIIDF
ncbi:Septum-promoting GTP-binding protein 1 [Glycine soja]|nr:Septum-promoting GTP-binding protein 1 [Glycine soja]